MFNLFKYKTPEKYAVEFKETYSYINIKQIKILGTLMLIVVGSVRLLNLVFYKEISALPNYNEYNLCNWFQIAGLIAFLTIGFFAHKWARRYRTLLTLIFVMFVLTTTFTVSYIVSLHQTKNTLVMFLIGIVAVSIFFSLEYHEIMFISIFVIVLFSISISLPKLIVQEKLFSIITSFILAFVLFSFSRYSYYFKSRHFVQVKQLEEKNQEVENLNRQKGEILGFVAHDLRNPLNNIEALSTMILKDDKIDENIRCETQMILDSSNQAKAIINDLLEVVQETNEILFTEKTDLSAYVNQICKNWTKHVHQTRTINFSATQKDFIVFINRSKLLRVLDNLIGNGIKFSAADTPIRVSLIKENSEALITITDYGIGIPNHLKDKLFDQFTKIGRKGLNGENSIGLGLQICKQIVEQHGGKITVRSKENEGSSFTISLPCCQA